MEISSVRRITAGAPVSLRKRPGVAARSSLILNDKSVQIVQALRSVQGVQKVRLFQSFQRCACSNGSKLNMRSTASLRSNRSTALLRSSRSIQQENLITTPKFTDSRQAIFF